MKMQKLTKITSSIGPASENHLAAMFNAGVNVFRLNFSHDTGAVQGARINSIRKLGAAAAIIADLQGPKHRIGNFVDGAAVLVAGKKFIFDSDLKPGDKTRVYLPDTNVLSALNVGNRILLSDGKIKLEVVKIKSGAIETRVIDGGELRSRAGFNLPDTEIDMPILTAKDLVDLEYALAMEVDFIAVSFVQKPEDIAEVRDFITSRTVRPVKIIAKIERPQALDRIDDIISASDAIMFARGDLAVEIPFEQLPALQRKIIRLCRNQNRPIIVATQMLGSMVHGEFPLRAEISDIGLTAYLRADSAMTSEETTIGDHPVRVVETMAKILSYTDWDISANPQNWMPSNAPQNDWSRSVVSMAELNKAAAIVVFDSGADIATQISCRRPNIPIIAVCNDAIYANQLCLCRGVFPIFDARIFGQRDAVAAVNAFDISRGKITIVNNQSISLTEL
jgi:pyruvate kinase